MDPILEYLLGFNETNSIEYKERYLIPPGGLAEMLGEYRKFHLNREEVVKSEVIVPTNQEIDRTTEELLALID